MSRYRALGLTYNYDIRYYYIAVIFNVICGVIMSCDILSCDGMSKKCLL